MSNFKDAIPFVLGNEGGYSNHKEDKGGATNYGISTRFLKQIDGDIDGDGHVTSKDVEALTHDGAIELYKEHFWDHYKLENIRDLFIARKALDLFVNMRGRSAGKILQRACNSCGADLDVDGLVGRKSFNALNYHSLFSESQAKLLDAIRTEQFKHYVAIVKADKSQNKFLRGWTARAAR